MASESKKRKKSSVQDTKKSKKHKEKEEHVNNEESELEAVPAQSIAALNLPDEVMIKIFSFFRLPKQLCRSSKVCKSWNRLASDPILWKQLLSNWNFKGDFHQTDADWKEVFKDNYLHNCVDCGELCDKVLYGKIEVPLCYACRDAYVGPMLLNQRFVSLTKAKNEFGLSSRRLAKLNHAMCGNPLDYRWEPMNLFWKSEIEDAAREKYGTIGKLIQKKKEKRLKRLLDSE